MRLYPPAFQPTEASVLNLNRLESCVIAAEKLSFSDAARQLQVSQPTISHHIKSLEEQLGVTLFARNGPQLQLTEAGRLLQPMAHRLLHQSFAVEEMMAACRDLVVGHLRIACSTTAGKYILPLLAARFRQRHPGIRVSIHSCTAAFLVNHLLKGEVNISVASTEILDPGLQQQPFFVDQIVLIVPANHPWTTAGPIQPEMILNEPLLMTGPGTGTRRVLMTELAKSDVQADDLNVFLELGNAEAIVHTVQAGYGIAFVSSLAAAAAVAGGRVAQVHVDGLDLQRTLYMIRKASATPNRVQDAFWSFVHDDSNADILQLPRQVLG